VAYLQEEPNDLDVHFELLFIRHISAVSKPRNLGVSITSPGRVLERDEAERLGSARPIFLLLQEVRVQSTYSGDLT